MTRNSRKLNRKPTQEFESGKEQQNQEAQKEQPQQPGNIFGLSFVVPTDDVELPSKGVYYPKTSPLHGLEVVEIKHMTAKEEDLLSTTTDINNKNVYDRLIDGLLVDKSLNSSMFLEEDKLAILLSARNTGYGSEYVVESTCDLCGAETDYTFDLTKTTVEDPKSLTDHDASYDADKDIFSLTLPKTGLEVEIRNFNQDDRDFLEKEKNQKEKYKIEYNSTIAFLERALVSVNSVTARDQIAKLVQVMPAVDAKTIVGFYNNCHPKLSTRQDVQCTSCGGFSAREVPFSWALFRTDI